MIKFLLPLHKESAMYKNIKIQLIDSKNMDQIIPLLSELDPDIPIELLKTRLKDMKVDGYECAGLYDQELLIGICGIWTLHKYYIGKHIEPDNVFIKPQYRNQGIGEKLNRWLEALAVKRNCRAIELNCYIKNEKGKKFWDNCEFKVIGVHYQKKLYDKYNID